jgi:hypothetical protein
MKETDMKKLWVFALAALAVSCGDGIPVNGKPETSADRAVFEAERAAWEAQNIQNYRFIGTLNLDYPSVPVLVTISPDADPVLECPPGFSETEFEQEAEKYHMFFAKTIGEIYSAIESNIEEALNDVSANPNVDVKIQIAYNAEYHYPESFSTGLYDRPSGQARDGGGWGFEISGFEQLDYMEWKTDAVHFDRERFQNERAAWEAQDITAYRFTAQMLLDYPVVPVRITVKDTGEPEVEPVIHDDLTEPDIEMAALYGKTIPDICASIEASIEKERNTPREEHHWTGITLKYNAEYHYPEFYSACEYYDDLPLPGGFTGVEISDFEILDD